MTAITFAPATKKQSRARIALVGPSNSGKTYTGLMLATNLGERVAVIDTERGSASKYADEFRFDVIELHTFEAEKYIEAIEAAAQAGYDVLLIDSLSHAWMGKGGILEKVDNAGKRSQSGNSFTAWRDVTPIHNRLVDAILQAPIHVIATLRTKTEYVIEEDARGKKVPRKVGLAPVQRDGLDYEFDVVADMNMAHEFIVTKTRCRALDGAVIEKPTKAVAETIKAWLTDGVAPPEPAPKPAAASGAGAAAAPKNGGGDKMHKRMWAMIREHELPVEDTPEGTFVTFAGKRFRPKSLSDDQVARFIDSMKAELEGV